MQPWRSEYVIMFCPRERWLRERPSILRYTYIAHLVVVSGKMRDLRRFFCDFRKGVEVCWLSIGRAVVTGEASQHSLEHWGRARQRGSRFPVARIRTLTSSCANQAEMFWSSSKRRVLLHHWYFKLHVNHRLLIIWIAHKKKNNTLISLHVYWFSSVV